MTYILVLTTTNTMESANKIAKTLVDERVAACVNIVPYIKSYYVWEGKTTADDEILLLIKSHSSMTQKLIQRIKELHPYKIPEIIIINFNEGFDKYLDWIKESVTLDENKD
ncbi:dihydroorotate dehydrogenase [Sulfolobus acidocaldarius SUSAZ]|nr:dihydroorotate dehydrogenase [Sulfolobus acidocaldarius SUSAZ]